MNLIEFDTIRNHNNVIKSNHYKINVFKRRLPLLTTLLK